RDFSARFGELEVHVSNVYQEPGIPEVMILSNVVENGKPIGLADAGQDWHTDMSYASMIAFANVLYAVSVPRRDGVTLGNTEFSKQAGGLRRLAGRRESAQRRPPRRARLRKVVGDDEKGPGL